MLRSLNKKLVHLLDRLFYPKFENNWDDKLFRQVCLTHINSDTVVLDVGAGRGALPEMNFKGIAKRIYGVDPVQEVTTNPYLDEGFVGLGDNMPFFEDEFFDVVISDNVLEHVESPEAFMKEVARVLKRGGVLLSKTPNKYHYLPLVASITPTNFHKWFNRVRGRSEVDTFPTQYKMNTRRDQTRYAQQFGLHVEKMSFIEGRPEYLRVTFLTYPFGILYEKIINTFGMNVFKVLIVSTFRKA